ncbi:MAG: hypothetical protein Q6M04_05950 [Thermostichus sp. BF3_bins_97]
MRIPTALIGLATPDLPRLQHFYQALLGIPAQVRIPADGDPVYVEFRLPGLRLGLYRAPHDPEGHRAPHDPEGHRAPHDPEGHRAPHDPEGHRSHHPDFVARAGAVSLCLQMQDLQGSLSELQAVLEDYQLPVSQVRRDFHGQEVDFLDPDGNRIVLHQPSAAFWQAMDWDPQS